MKSAFFTGGFQRCFRRAFCGENSEIKKLNENSLFEEERKCLLPYMPPLELAQPANAKVDKTALISVDCVKYSVPEQLVGEVVFVKKYHETVRRHPTVKMSDA